MSDWHSGQPTPPPPGQHPAGGYGAIPPIAPPPFPPPGGGHPGGPGWSPYGGFPPQPPKKTPWLPIVLAVVGVLALIGIVATSVILLTGGDDDSKSSHKGRSDTSSESSESASESATDEQSEETDDPSGAASATLPPVGGSIERDDIVGTWTGTYTCNQGETNLTLTVEAGPGSEELAAVFAFSPPEPGEGASGSFEMTGKNNAGKVDLTAGAWIDQPDGYSTVGLQGWVLSAQKERMFGNVIGSGCTTFELTRK